MLGHGVANIAQHNSKVGVDSGANLFHEHILSALRSHLLLLLGRLVGKGPSIGVELGWLVRLLLVLRWHDAAAVLLVVSVVCEEVVLLGVDDGLNDFAGVVALTAQNVDDNIHNDGAHGREAHEDTVDNSSGQLLQLRVDILKEFDCGLAQLLKLGLDQVVEHID